MKSSESDKLKEASSIDAEERVTPSPLLPDNRSLGNIDIDADV